MNTITMKKITYALGFAIFAIALSIAPFSALAVDFTSGCCTGGWLVHLDGGGGGFGGGGGDGGGGGGFSPYCTITISQNGTQQYVLSWTAAYATSFSIDHGIGLVTPATAGTYIIGLYADTGTPYTGTAVTPYGTVTCQTQVIPPPPPTCTLNIVENQCQPGDSISITWTTTNASTFVIDHGVGSVTPVAGGSVPAHPTMTTTYTGTATGPGGTVTCSDTIIVNTPPPQCELNLTAANINWSTTGANNVQIVPLTNSPQVPGASIGGSPILVPHTQGDAYTNPAVIADMQSNGINFPSVQWNTGIFADQATMDRVCVLIDGPGSTAYQFGVGKYNSPGDNAVVLYSGSSWQYIAGYHKFHLSSSFTCSKPEAPSTYPLSGSYNFVPPLGVGTHTYQLTATGPGGTAMCTKTVVVPPPSECKLQITKSVNYATVAAGGQVEYTINFKNIGDKKCTGSGVKVVDVVDSGLTYVSETHSANVDGGYGTDPVYKSADHTLRWNAWDLDPNESGWVKFKATANTPSSCSVEVPNKAKITSYEYNNFNTFVESNVVMVTVNKDCTPPPPTECKLTITKSVNYATVAAGGQVEYTVTFKNIGGKKCTGSGVRVVDVVDTGLTYVSETHSANVDGGYGTDPVYKSADHTLRWNAWDLDPNETGWVKFKATANTPSSCSVEVPNKVKITSAEYNNFNTWVESNVATVTVTKDCTPPPPTECKLEISKTVSDTSVAPNDVIEYTINFKNIGDKKCTGSGVKVVDVVDSGLTYVSETHSANVDGGYGTDPVYKSADHTLRWNAWDLDPNETGWVKFKAKVGTPSTCSETIPNAAKITSYEYNNFNTFVTSNVVSVIVTKSYCNVPQPYCTMSVTPTSIASGQSATLSWNSTNVTTVTIDQGVGSVNTQDSKVVSPTANTTYTGTFTGPGGTVTCTASIIVTQPLVPACTLTASANQVESGAPIKLTWTSVNVTDGSINQSIGSTSPVSGGTTGNIFPSDDTTYVGTFSGPNGTVSCSVQVKITRHGCTGSCGGGGGPDSPTVQLYKQAGNQELAFVYLSQIPYTGFEAGPALTVIFWLAIGLFSALIAYFAAGADGMRFVLGYAMGMAGVAIPEEESEYEKEKRHESYGVEYPTEAEEPAYVESVIAMPRATAVRPVAPAPSRYNVEAIVEPKGSAVAIDGIPQLHDVIESRAHAAGILMSPEAVDLAGELTADRISTLKIFGDILNEAVRTLPREDGWIMLTSDRFEVLKTTVMSSTDVPAMPVASQTVASAPVIQASAMKAVTVDEAAASEFVGAILSGDRDTAYAIVRALEHDHVSPTSLVTATATVLDKVYRARKDGRALTDQNLEAKSKGASIEVLASLVETFAHAVDTVYASPFTGVKLALAQAFEVLG